MKRAEFQSLIRFATLAAITATSCFFVQPAHAVDTIWTGGTDTDWTLPGNWSGGTPTGTDNALFSGTFSNQPNVGTPANVGGIWMTGTPGVSPLIDGGSALTISGNTINAIGGLGILVDNTDAQTLTIAAPLILGNAQEWTNNSSNVLTLGAINTNGKALTIDGTGNVTFGGVISGSGPITLAGTGSSVITFSVDNSFTGALAIKSGTVSIDAFGRNNNDAELGHSNSSGVPAVTLGDAGGGTATIRYTGPDATGRTKNYSFAAGGTGVFDIPTGVSVALTGTLGGTGSFTKAGQGTLTVTASLSTYAATGLTTVDAGVLDIIVGSNGTYYQGGITGSGTIRNNSDSASRTLTVGGPINTFTGTFKLEAGKGNQFTFGGADGNQLDGSNAIFHITGPNQDTITMNRGPRMGNTDGTTMKMGGLVSNVTDGPGLIRPNNSLSSTGIASSVSWEIGGAGGDRVFIGDIMDSTDYTRVEKITKVGTGSQTLAGSNSAYSGATIVSSGTLIAAANVNSTRLVQKSTMVDLGTDVFTTANHGLSNGDRVIFDARSGALTGLTNDTVTYFVINATPTTYQVSTIAGGSAVDITTDTTMGLNVEYGVAPDSVNDKIAITNHGFQNGDKVLLGQSGGTMPTGLTNNKPYYVVNKTDNDFQVSSDGINPLDFTTDGTAVFAVRPGGLGAGNSAITLNDANTGNNDVSFATYSTPNTPLRVERAITVAPNAGSGVTGIGGLSDNNSTYSGLVTVNKNLTVAQIATTGGNALYLTGGITSGGGSQTITFGKATSQVGPLYGDIKIETAGISDGSGQLAVDVNNPGYTVTFSAPNTYTGDTKVTAGTLSAGLVNNLADAADVYLTTGAIFDLNFSGTDTIDSLFFDGSLQATGTWGGSGSGADHISSFFTGSGLLSVSTSASLAGDYNLDGQVDAADYVVWRKNPTVVGGGDPIGYTTWRANFGNSSPGSGSGSNLENSGAVPEPSALAIVLPGAACLIGGQRREARNRK